MNGENQLILDAEQGIRVDENLVRVLKPHQKDGVAFMWKALYENHHGCILAHTMGLGKTLQVVAIIHTLVARRPTAKILIVCPIIVIKNWENEIKKWTELTQDRGLQIYIEKLQSYLDKKEIDFIKKNWCNPRVGGVFIIGYEKYKNLMNENSNTFDGCDLLICDEGHVLKNKDSLSNKMINKITTKCRIILSGTPLQNNLEEYFQLMKLVKADVWYRLFNVRSEEDAKMLYERMFTKPMTEGQYIDSSSEQYVKMLNRSYVLHDLLKPYIHRKNGFDLAGMPEKKECVLYVCLTDLQKKLYKEFLAKINVEKLQTKKYKKLFRDKNISTLICNHPKALEERDVIDFAENELIPSDDSGPVPDDFGSWWQNCCTSVELKQLKTMEASNKMKLLFSILRESELCGDKVLVFSHSLATLNIIEHFLEQNDMLRNRYYFRMDGNTKSEKRNDDINDFNTNETSKLYLISTRAGGVGINLVSANRVILFDLSWNPSQEIQSIYRVYRIGQGKPCKIYRFVAAGTFEEKIYNRQIEKIDLAERVVDLLKVQPHLRESDLKELYEDFVDNPPRDFSEELRQNPFFAGQLQLNIVTKCNDRDRLFLLLNDFMTEERKAEAYADYDEEFNGLS